MPSSSFASSSSSFSSFPSSTPRSWPREPRSAFPGTHEPLHLNHQPLLLAGQDCHQLLLFLLVLHPRKVASQKEGEGAFIDGLGTGHLWSTQERHPGSHVTDRDCRLRPGHLRQRCRPLPGGGRFCPSRASFNSRTSSSSSSTALSVFGPRGASCNSGLTPKGCGQGQLDAQLLTSQP